MSMFNVLNRTGDASSNRSGDACIAQAAGSPRDWSIPLVIFVLTLAVCIINGLCIPQAPTTLIFDSQQYQWTTAQVGEVLKSLIRLHPNFEPINNPIFHKTIMLDGPILPVFHALVLAFIGKVATAGQWQTLVWIESVLHALSAVVVFYICKAVNTHRWITNGCTAFWALYPPAVIASSRFLSENLTVLALLFLVLGLCKCFDAQGRKLLFWAASVGITSALIVLLKPALAPGAAAALLLCIARNKDNRLRILLPMLLAAATIVLPWAAYTKVVTGKIQITAQRYPAYNLAIGCNTEVHSWCTMPHDSFTELMQDDNTPFAPVVSQWSQKPAECARLIAEKIQRLYAHPWNDFRKTFLGLNDQAQYGFHWALLFLGFAGFFNFVLHRQRFSPAQQQLAFALMLLAFSQCTYLLFEAVARYSFTVMPLLILFAAFVSKRNLVPFGIAAIVVLAICFTTDNSEHAYSLTANSTATKIIDLSKTEIPFGMPQSLLIIDGDRGLDNASVLINGHPIAESLLPFHYYDANLYSAIFYNDQLAWASNISPDDIRTWRAVPIDPAILNRHGPNIVEIKSNAPTVVYADDKKVRSMPAANFIIPDKVCNSAFDLDPRVASPIPCGNVTQQSTLNGTVLPHSLRVRFAFIPSTPGGAGVSPALTNRPGGAGISPALTNRPGGAGISPALTNRPGGAGVPPALTNRPGGAGVPPALTNRISDTRINKRTWKSTQSASFTFPIPDPSTATHLHIRLTGSVRSLNNPCKVSALVSCKGTGVFTVPLWKIPRSLTATPQWTTFTIDDLFPIGTVKPTDVEVLLCPGEWQKTCFYGFSRDNTDAEFKDLELTISPETRINMTNRAVYFY
jgi:hypothetical protein